jgi:hypothetical protein
VARTYEEFVEYFHSSKEAVLAVARWAWDEGHDVFIPAMKLRPKHDFTNDYRDDGDLHITKDGLTKKLNVKHKSVTFSGPKDFPFPLIFVANKKSADSYGDNISSYVIVSNDMKCACVINKKQTWQFWSVIKFFNEKHHYHEEVYACPIVQAKFYQIG